jgi:uncharacterized membrane protein YfcA
MGLTLGLVGAGGSILTIPILVYIFKIPISLSTKYSLIIVGSTAFVGVMRYRNLIYFKKSLLFYIPSSIGVAVTRYYVLPSLPKTIWKFSLDEVLTLLFVLTMLSASYFLLNNSKKMISCNGSDSKKYHGIIMTGLFVGFIMGLLGVGGGFLIIPALIFLNIKMKHAIPTSLFIIMINSFIGFFSDRRETTVSEYKMLFLFILIAWIGTYLGILLNKKISGKHLKQAFGILLLFVSVSITFIEIYF